VDWELLHRTFARWIQDCHLAADLLQQVGLNMLSYSIDRLRDIRTPHGYILKLAWCLYLNWHRDHRKFDPLPERDMREAPASDPEKLVGDQQELDHRQQKLYHLLKTTLSKEDYFLLTSVRLQGKKIEDVADRLGITPVAARKRLSRCFQKLRAKAASEESTASPALTNPNTPQQGRWRIFRRGARRKEQKDDK